MIDNLLEQERVTLEFLRTLRECYGATPKKECGVAEGLLRRKLEDKKLGYGYDEIVKLAERAGYIKGGICHAKGESISYITLTPDGEKFLETII